MFAAFSLSSFPVPPEGRRSASFAGRDGLAAPQQLQLRDYSSAWHHLLPKQRRGLSRDRLGGPRRRGGAVRLSAGWRPAQGDIRGNGKPPKSVPPLPGRRSLSSGQFPPARAVKDPI